MRLLSLLFFFVISITQHVTVYAVDDLLLVPPTLSCPSFPKRNKVEEGFGSNTLVLANCGYKKIGEFVLSEHIIDDCSQQIDILGTQKGIAKKYVKIGIENTTICAGCKQQFYVFPDRIWVMAENLEAGAQLLGSCGECYRVNSVEIIDESIVLHALTVEDQVFFVTPYNLLVHNMDAMALDATALALEYITISNPVIALLGAGVALSTVAYQAYNEYTQQQSIDISDNMEVSLPSKVCLAERYYYERRKADLEKLKTELVNVKQGLEAIQSLRCSNSINFTHQFLQQMQQAVEIKCCAL